MLASFTTQASKSECSESPPLVEDFKFAAQQPNSVSTFPTHRIASLDAFRDLSVFLMILVDYGAFLFPVIAYAPWNCIHLADLVMPFFLFIAGISISLVYKRRPSKTQVTWKALVKALKLFILGIFLQGGYFHGITSLTYVVDIERIHGWAFYRSSL